MSPIDTYFRPGLVAQFIKQFSQQFPPYAGIMKFMPHGPNPAENWRRVYDPYVEFLPYQFIRFHLSLPHKKPRMLFFACYKKLLDVIYHAISIHGGYDSRIIEVIIIMPGNNPAFFDFRNPCNQIRCYKIVVMPAVYINEVERFVFKIPYCVNAGLSD